MSEIKGIERLQKRIRKYDDAMDRVSFTEDSIGKSFGPHRFRERKIGAEETSRQESIAGIRLQLAERTFAKLVEKTDMLQELHSRATKAEEDYRVASEKYLTSDGNPKEDEQFEEAVGRLRGVEQEIEAVFQPRPKKKDLSDKKTQDTNRTKAVVRRSETAVGLRPARINFTRGHLDYLSWASKVSHDPVPVATQIDELRTTVARVRSGAIEMPSVTDFARANDVGSTALLEPLIERSIQGLIANMIVSPDGTINDSPGLENTLARELNTLIGLTTTEVRRGRSVTIIDGAIAVSDAISRLPTVQRELLCNSLSVTMKEKLGNPDIDICSPEDAAMYLSHALYDVLAENRLETLRRETADYFGASPFPDSPVWKEQFHRRDTTIRMDLEDIFQAIIERDARDGNSHYAQRVIDAMIVFNREHSRSQSSDSHVNVLDFTFKQWINYFEEQDLLGELEMFFSSNSKTEKYARIISRRIERGMDDEFKDSRNAAQFYDGEKLRHVRD